MIPFGLSLKFKGIGNPKARDPYLQTLLISHLYLSRVTNKQRPAMRQALPNDPLIDDKAFIYMLASKLQTFY